VRGLNGLLYRYLAPHTGTEAVPEDSARERAAAAEMAVGAGHDKSKDAASH
jgi:hypothetical protein